MRAPLLSCVVTAFISLTNCLFLSSTGSVLQQPLTGSNGPDEKSVLAALKEAEIIPDVLDTFEVDFLINPIYPEADKRVELGNKLAPEDVELAPDLELTFLPEKLKSSTKAKYTLVLSDPDALSHENPVRSQMCHWIVTNITLPGLLPTNKHLLSFGVLTTEAESGIVQLKSYFPPAPPPKTGYHRYVFAFLLSNSDNSTIPKAPKERPHWGYSKVGAGIREWASDNDMMVVGANFFYAQNEKQ